MSSARFMSLFLAIALLGLSMLAGGCEPSAASSRADGQPLNVVATTTMIGDLVRQIAGDQVQLRVMMGSGVDPHAYKPSVADMGYMRKADVIFYNGLHLEGKMVNIFEHRLEHKAVPVTRDVPVDRLLPWNSGQSGAFDPHVWFDVMLWTQAAHTVRDELVRLDPANAEVYRQRADRLIAELHELDSYVRQQIASIPESRRVLITSHDAYAYFGRTYGIQVLGLQGISTESEAGLMGINSAVDFIVQRGIPSIFIESSVSPRTIQRVQADCRSRGVEVRIGGELYSDAMGSPGEHPGYAVETYVGMVRYNVDTIVKGLR